MVASGDRPSPTEAAAETRPFETPLKEAGTEHVSGGEGSGERWPPFYAPA